MLPSPLPAEGWNYLFKWKFEINQSHQIEDKRNPAISVPCIKHRQVSAFTCRQLSFGCVQAPRSESTRRRVANWQQQKGFLIDGVSVENWGVIAKHAPEILSISHLSPEHRGTLTFLTVFDRLATLAPLPLLFKTRVHKCLLPASSYGRPAAPGLLWETYCVGRLPFRSTLTRVAVFHLCVIIWMRPELSCKAPSGSGQDFLWLSTVLSICSANTGGQLVNAE